MVSPEIWNVPEADKCDCDDKHRQRNQCFSGMYFVNGILALQRLVVYYDGGVA